MAEITADDLFGSGDLGAPLKSLDKELSKVIASMDRVISMGGVLGGSFKDLSTSIVSVNTGSVEMDKLLKQLAKAEGDLKKATDKTQESFKDNGDSIQSIDNLTKANKALREERKKLDLQSEGGKKRVSEINKSLDANTSIVKNNSSALEKQRLNIGNYQGAFEKLAPAQAAAAQGFLGIAKSMLAVIATPIGFILGVLATVIGLVTKALQKMDPVMDFIEDAVTQVTNAFDFLIQNLDKIAYIVGNVLVGNFAAASVAADELGTAFKHSSNEAQRLLDLTRDLANETLIYEVNSASAANTIKALVAASKNRGISIEEEQRLLKEASDLENSTTAESVRLAQKAYDIQIGLFENEFAAQLKVAKLKKEASETDAEYLKRLIESKKFDEERFKVIVDAYKRVEQEASAGLALQEKINNQVTKSEEERAAKSAKYAAEKEKQLQAEIKYKEWLANIDKGSIKSLEAEAAKEQAIRATFLKKLGMDKASELKLSQGFDEAIAKSREAINARIAGSNERSLGLFKENVAVTVSEISEIYNQFAGEVSTLFSNISAGNIQDLDMEQRANKTKLDADLLAAGDNEARKKQLKDRAARDDAKIEAQKLAIKQRTARFDKAIAGVGAALNMARGITSALAMYPPNVPLAIFVGALGAIQLASIAAQPIPKYFVGTENAAGGAAWVGERGTELVKTPDGVSFLTPDKPTLMNIPKGSKISTHDETMKELAKAGMRSTDVTATDYMMARAIGKMERAFVESNEKVANEVRRSNGKLIRQGSVLYSHLKDQDGNSKIILAKTFNK